MSGNSWRTIFVGNLPFNVRESEIEDLFYKYGRILNIDLRIPNHPPCFCFVEFENSRDAEDAIRGRDGYNFDGCRLRVEFAHGRRGPSSSSGPMRDNSLNGNRSRSPMRDNSLSGSRSRSPMTDNSLSGSRSRSLMRGRSESLERSASRSPSSSPVRSSSLSGSRSRSPSRGISESLERSASRTPSLPPASRSPSPPPVNTPRYPVIQVKVEVEVKVSLSPQG